MDYFKNLVNYLHDHDVKIIKDIIVPTFSLDKIIALIGIIYIARSFGISNRLAKVNFIYSLTQSHRDIWSKINERNLYRILDDSADPNLLTKEEERHIIFVILNIKVSYEAHHLKISKLNPLEFLDIGNFMNLPLTNHVWSRISKLHSKKFNRYIAYCKYFSDPQKNPKPISILKERTAQLHTCLLIGMKKFYNLIKNAVSSILGFIKRKIKH